jgi:acetyltransferase-like isoleucine patch superfamily enzyme
MTCQASTIHELSSISNRATLGTGVTVGPFSVIRGDVVVGDGAFIGSNVVIGEPVADFYHSPSDHKPEECRIGRNAVIRSHTVIYGGVTIGDDFVSGHHVIVREGSRIGDGVVIGTRSELQGDLNVGDYARVHSGVFVGARSTIEEFVWLFPHVVLTNDPHPPSDTCTLGPTIRRFAVVGATATIMPAVEIGEGAVVGAMSLVREDVPPDSVVVGMPAEVTSETADVKCAAGRLERVYPWWVHFRRGYPEGVLPSVDPD